MNSAAEGEEGNDSHLLVEFNLTTYLPFVLLEIRRRLRLHAGGHL